MKHWGKRILLGAASLVLVAWATGALLMRHWTAKPPPRPADTSITLLKLEQRDGRTWLGESWTGRREGLLVVYLKGSSFDIGYAAGKLLEPQIHTLENEFVGMIRGYVPNAWTLTLLKWYVTYRNRHLPNFVPLAYQLEILGITTASADIHPEFGPYYHRMLNYHAAHDVSYMMIDNPLIARAGCTSFGAWGGETKEGHLLSGRNFDWEAAEVFSRDRVVEMCEPDRGIPFISLSWAGMAGVVSGMNRAGVSVSLNGAPSNLPGEIATPAAIVARDLLQHAHNLAEATDLLRSAKVFVSTLWLVGSRADGRFIVVEKTPTSTHVREPEGDSIICPNHFETPGLRDDEHNRAYMAESTSTSREARMVELLQQNRGAIAAPKAAEMLRDRNLPGGVFAGNGHRGTLNALIATHAMVVDLTDGIFWAASPPNMLGQFVAFDVQDFSRELPGLTVPPDAALASGEYERAKQAGSCLAAAQRLLRDGKAEAALQEADKAESLNPGFYQNAALRGHALSALNRPDEAARAFTGALSAHPAFLKERQELEVLCARDQHVE